MAEYVEKSIIFPALNKAMSENGVLGMADVEDIIDDLPTADVQPVIYAHKTINVGRRSYCSNCGKLAIMEDFCSKCGAKVKGGEENA